MNIDTHEITVGKLSKVMTRHMNYSEEDSLIISNAAEVHDIGKAIICSTILNAPRKLSGAEFEKIKEHPVFGAAILTRLNYCHVSIGIVKYHHEKWDGTGYPEGLSGDAIPMEAQIVSVCDVYQALSAKRSYKNILDHHEILAIMRPLFGSHFNPKLQMFFEKSSDEFMRIITHEKSKHNIIMGKYSRAA